MTKRSYVEWLDCNERFQETRWYHTDATTADALLATIQGHSACGVRQRGDAPLVIVDAVPDGTPYATRDFEAILTFCTAANSLVQLRIPGPNMDIFLAAPNGDMIDETKIADLIAAAIGVLTDRSGNPVVRYNGGVLYQRAGLGVT